MNAKDLLKTPGLLTENDEPVFSEPWQAKAFAIVVQLAEANIFEWKDWVECFSAEVAKAEQNDYQPERDYYHCWVRALENLITKNQISNNTDIEHSVADTLTHWPHPDHTAQIKPVHISPALS